MRRYARTFLRNFLAHFLWVFVVVQAFFGLAMMLAILTSHPYVPLAGVARAFLDVMLTILPLSLPFSVLLAGLLYARDMRACGGFLSVQLVGRDPRALQWPLLAVALAMSLVMLWLHQAALPMARYHARHVVKTTAETSDALAVRLARKPRFLRGYTASFASTTGATMHGFLMTANREEADPMLVTATTARLAPAEDERYLQVELRAGRYLRFGDDGGIKQNLRFDELRLQVDAARLSLPSKRDLPPLKFYTDEELDRLPEQRARMIAGGKPPKPDHARRVEAVPSTRALRWQSAFLPLLVMALLVQFLGVHREGGRRGALLAAGVLLLFLQQIILEGRVEKGGTLTPSWLVLLPAFEVAAAVALCELVRRRRVGR